MVYRRKRELNDEEELNDMPPLDGDEEEVKEWKGLKLLFLIIIFIFI